MFYKINILQKDYAYRYFEIVHELKKEIKQAFSKNVDILDIDSKSEFLDTIKKEMIYV